MLGHVFFESLFNIGSRKQWEVGCANGMFISCGIFQFVAGILEVSRSERGRDSC